MTLRSLSSLQDPAKLSALENVRQASESREDAVPYKPTERRAGRVCEGCMCVCVCEAQLDVSLETAIWFLATCTKPKHVLRKHHWPTRKYAELMVVCKKSFSTSSFNMFQPQSKYIKKHTHNVMSWRCGDGWWWGVSRLASPFNRPWLSSPPLLASDCSCGLISWREMFQKDPPGASQKTEYTRICNDLHG